DTQNSRVLEYSPPLSSGMNADLVFGQSGFTSKACNAATGIGSNTLCSPQGVAADVAGNLYVADTGNSRAVEFNTPLIVTSTPGSGDTVADLAFGVAHCNTTTNSLCHPSGLALDVAGNLYIADTYNNRTLEFYTPLYVTSVSGSGNTSADLVFGQL